MQALRVCLFLAIAFAAISHVLGEPEPSLRALRRCYRRGGCGPEYYRQPVYQPQPVYAAPQPQQAPITIVQKQNTVVKPQKKVPEYQNPEPCDSCSE